MNPSPADELSALLALTCTPHVGVILARQLVSKLGTATAVYEHRTELPDILPGVRPSLIQALDCPAAWQRARTEMDFINRHHIRPLTINDAAYPSRLRECDDAPLVLYTLGNVDFNAAHVVSIVGTRKATSYGQELCASFVRDLAAAVPDLLIVSGLAYGIDVAAHRASLQQGASTVGVLAHGLDRIYPSVHRSVASQMSARQGSGLVTEYMSLTEPERQNFLQRNRIIAGLADAIVVVESAAKGGALITADIAQSYNRDCFAFPGRVSDEYSRGCNNLIKGNVAALITCADDFLKAMNWETSSDAKAVQRQLFVDLTPDEERVLAALRNQDEGIHINQLAVETDIPAGRLYSILFSLEMKGTVQSLAGARFKAIG